MKIMVRTTITPARRPRPVEMSITHSSPARRTRSERLHGTFMPLKGGLPVGLWPNSRRWGTGEAARARLSRSQWLAGDTAAPRPLPDSLHVDADEDAAMLWRIHPGDRRAKT